MKLKFLISCLLLQALYHTASATNCTEGSWRLWSAYDTTPPNEGIPQRCSQDGIWESNCRYFSGYGSVFGRVLCNYLGFNRTIPYSAQYNLNEMYGTNMLTQFYEYDYRCTGEESTPENCTRFSYACPHTPQTRALRCIPTNLTDLTTPECTNGELRLTGGQSANEGRMEYCYEGFWSPFCSFSNVVCRLLGYRNYPYYEFDDERFGRTGIVSPFGYFGTCFPGSMPVLCAYVRSGSNPQPCATEYGVRCYNNGVCTDGDVRLADGDIDQMGRPELCFDGLWSTVCSNKRSGDTTKWDTHSASIVCRHLGYPGGSKIFSPFGESYWPISVTARCDLNDDSVSSCFYLSGSSYCYQYQSTVGVLCLDDCTDTDIRLVGGSDMSHGTVEICYGKVWGLIADIGWNTDNAIVVCRQLGFNGTAEAVLDSTYGRPNRTVHLKNVQCTGSEGRLENCPFNIIPFDTGRGYYYQTVSVAGVQCGGVYIGGGGLITTSTAGSITPTASIGSMSSSSALLSSSSSSLIPTSPTVINLPSSSTSTSTMMVGSSSAVTSTSSAASSSSSLASSSSPVLAQSSSLASSSSILVQPASSSSQPSRSSTPTRSIPAGTTSSQQQQQPTVTLTTATDQENTIDAATVYSIMAVLGVTILIILLTVVLLFVFVMTKYKRMTNAMKTDKDFEGITNPSYEKSADQK